MKGHKTLLKFVMIFVFTFIFSVKAKSNGQVARVVVEHWPPWEIAYDETKEEVTAGVAVEIVQEIFSRLDINFELHTAPWKRALLYIEEGKYDLIPMVSQNAQRTGYMVFTIPVYNDLVLLAYSTDKFKHFKWDKWEDLKPYEIRAVRGYNYGKAWNSAVEEYGLHVEESVTDIQNIKMLIGGRIELALLGYSSGVGIIRRMGGRGHEKIRFVENPIYKTVYNFGISKKSFLAKRLPEINKVLQEMKADGTLKKIMKELYIE